jgi:hypothetical protein
MKPTSTGRRSRRLSGPSTNSTPRRRKKSTNPKGTVDKLTDRVVDMAQGAAEQVGALVKGTAHMIAGTGEKARRSVASRLKT